MDEEIRTAWQAILKHQLQGIMFHSEVSLMYKLLKHKTESRIHDIQFIEESMHYQMCLKAVAEEYGEIIFPAPGIERIKVAGVDLTNLKSEDADKIAENASVAIKEIVRRKPSDAKGDFVQSISVASTMGPSVTVDAKDVL